MRKISIAIIIFINFTGAHNKETNENIRYSNVYSKFYLIISPVMSLRMTSISKREDHSERVPTHDEDKRNAQLSNKSTARVSKANPGKGKKQTRASTDREKDFSLDRTASEGTSGRANVSLTYKRAQNPENRENQVPNKLTSDMYRSASYSVVGGINKDVKDKKRLPAIPGTASHAGDMSKHDYDKVKGADADKTHKYANIDLSEELSTDMGIMEPKYDAVDTESTKKGCKTDKNTQKDKPSHYYHTLEESQIEETEGGINEEEYSSPTRKGLVVSRVEVHDKTGKGQVLSTDDSATVKGRAKSYSGKKSSKKDGKNKDHEYDQPSHKTLPHRSSASTDKPNDDHKESTVMQKGNLVSMFDDPMYVASMNVSAGGTGSTKTTPTSPQPPPRESSPKRASAEMPPAPILRKTEQGKQPTDDHKYDEPNEKKPARLTKKAIYSSKLFDDPKYEENFPNN